MDLSVFLGPAEEFLDYDSSTGDLSLKDPDAPITPGVYEIKVIVHDDGRA